MTSDDWDVHELFSLIRDIEWKCLKSAVLIYTSACFYKKIKVKVKYNLSQFLILLPRKIYACI